MSEMIERVAKAIWLQRCKNVGADPTEGFIGMAWESQSSRHAEMRAEARAAVTAMREPTDRMNVAGHDAGERTGKFTCHKPYAPAVWQAAVDEALK